jgi:hypothetical protein
MPADELRVARQVKRQHDLAVFVSRPGLRVVCAGCGAEVMNAREVVVDGHTFYRACAGERYHLAGAEPGLGRDQTGAVGRMGNHLPVS